MSNYVLGLHGVSAHSKRLLHDTGVSLVSDEKVIASINEERLSRKKNDGLFPWRTYKKIMKEHSLSPQKIAAVAFPDKKALWQTYYILKYALQTYKETGIVLSKYVQASIKRALDYKRMPPNSLKGLPTYFIEHHLCHAASAYYTSPWSDVAIVTLDGMGDWCIGGTINVGENGKIKTLKKTNGFYSPGFFYMFITSLLGYTPGRHEGKIMGLAAYGNPENCYPIVREMIQYRKEKHDFYSHLIPYELREARYLDGDMKSDFTLLKEKIGNFDAKDISAAAQKRLEEVVIEYIKDAMELTNKRRLVLAGGVFANVKLNEKILSLKEVDNLYVHPNMGDGGLATGAALYAFHNYIKKTAKEYTSSFMKTVYLGPSYSLSEIKRTLHVKKIRYQIFEHIEKKIAQAVHEGKIIGLFKGRMEYGPRALGNRSILARATERGINAWLNTKLKRTEFMPFAPSVLEEEAQTLFLTWRKEHVASRFMTLTYSVKEEWIEKVPAVVHVDRTARPHIVRQEENPFFHRILQEYKKISGLPLLINTSFNIHEEPIVCSPSDAIKAFIQGHIDVLVMENCWVELSDNQHVINEIQ